MSVPQFRICIYFTSNLLILQRPNFKVVASFFCDAANVSVVNADLRNIPEVGFMFTGARGADAI